MAESLFSQSVYQPLAARMRPQSVDEFVGQHHLLGEGKALRQAIVSGELHSMITWGPPGVGKTTLAKMIAHTADANFLAISAVLSGVKEIRQAVARAEEERDTRGRKTILFVDEVHRFNKSQQDAFLPYVENGTVIFIGATTENPSFELNNALLSRCRVYVLKPLEGGDLSRVLDRALSDSDKGLGGRYKVSQEARDLLINAADGDARRVLNLLEIASDLLDGTGSEPALIEQALVEQVLVSSHRRFDKGGEYFYDQISALHKAVRGSSPDAALYWLARMLDGGCDPLYVARRVLRMASEDVGNADPRALRIALDAWEVQERLGSPEGELAIAQAVVYMAVAPKSNAVYKAFGAASKDVRATGSLEVPLHIRNAPTRLMKELDYGADYRYAHDEDEGFAAGENYFPEALSAQQYYFPSNRGMEIQIAEKLRRLRELNAASPRQRYKRGEGD
ncbi:MAG TPA: recombination factor protein RarA [Porticoccaceae bacterium]|nr:recombination factor protein RarA [Porticoccaceae bacterium]HCO61652.1 recombination factor protein RarA [Porticoccaceae bacterium]